MMQQAYAWRPLPTMPSQLFLNLAESQMELLSFSLRKISSMSLYLPQENLETGQLEFLPAMVYPPPHSERVFIANDASSGEAPSLPRTLTKLPGFQHAASLIPTYPIVISDSPGVGTVEEVMCDRTSKTSALSVPLFRGSQTVGVLLVWSKSDAKAQWSNDDKEQISRAAQSLSLALSMDTERNLLQKQSENLQTQLSDALHQVKNPIQALRTYGKLLQRKLADSDVQDFQGGSPQLLELAQHLMVQSDRVVDLMSPIDTIVSSLPAAKKPLALNPFKPPVVPIHTALTPWNRPRNTEELVEFTRKSNESDRTPANGTTATVSDGTLEFSSSNGTFEFTRDNDYVIVQEPHSSYYSQVTPPVEPLEMGFVMDILDPIFAASKALASERGINLEIESSDDLCGVWVRPKALQEAVSNVLDNALKYVVLGETRHPKVTVRVQACTSEPGIRVRIEDNGPGIPTQEREAIFHRGYRGTRTETIDGTGIGLDISRSMILAMGGKLVLVDSINQGSTFDILLFRKKHDDRNEPTASN
jgi:signal transduction histidine kinase